jgi:hypothetical protein
MPFGRFPWFAPESAACGVQAAIQAKDKKFVSNYDVTPITADDWSNECNGR